MPRLLKSHFVSAVLGGLVVGGALLVSGVAGRSHTETIVDQAPLVAQKAADPISGETPLQIYERFAPGVVFVRAKLVEQVDSPFNLFHARESQTSTGTGFLVDRVGDILTNYHIIDGADRSKGISVEFENAIVRNARVVAVDESNDLAVLRSDMHGVLPIVPLARGDSTSVRVGDPTLTIGNPFGVDRTLTSGSVSALQHTIVAADGSRVNNVIQVDQAPDAGNSGAPLIDANGRVIGINSQMITGGGGVLPAPRLRHPHRHRRRDPVQGQPRRDAEGGVSGDRRAHHQEGPGSGRGGRGRGHQGQSRPGLRSRGRRHDRQGRFAPGQLHRRRAGDRLYPQPGTGAVACSSGVRIACTPSP